MRKSLCSFLTVSGLVLGGCAGSFEYTPRTLPPDKWQASNVSFAIEDERRAASAALPSVPAVTLGGGGETKDMRLPPQFSEFVRWRLAQLVAARGPRLRLVIVPERVRAGWSASLWAETETASVALHFRITTEDGSRVLVEGRGEGAEEFSSADASDEELARVFRAACNDAFDAFFTSAPNVQQLNEATAPAAPTAKREPPPASPPR